MNGEFAIIAEFLDRNGPEVMGRAIAPPPPELAERLERFARGEATQGERAALCQALQSQPEYLRSLAAQVRNLRKQTEARPGE